MASTGQDAVGSVGAGPEAARACHDLLVSLAGRVPDHALWRLRDWLAADADVALRTAVPRTLLRHRVGVTETERALLREAVQAWRGPVRLVDAVLHADPAPEVGVRRGNREVMCPQHARVVAETVDARRSNSPGVPPKSIELLFIKEKVC